MPDFDINKAFEKGLRLKSVFVEIFSFSASVFIAFQWQKLFGEIVNTFWIEGTNLFQKIILNTVLTVIVVSFVYVLLRLHKESVEK